jgi:hypothetical protein
MLGTWVSYPARGEEPAVVEALKVRALPEGSCDKLLEFLRLYRDAARMVVDRVWGINEELSKKKLHRLFYSDLVKLGLRAHHAKEVYLYARSLVESARGSGGRKPILRRLSARVDRYDYRLDLDSMVLTLKLHSGYEVRLRLVTSGGGSRGSGAGVTTSWLLSTMAGGSGSRYTLRGLLDRWSPGR